MQDSRNNIMFRKSKPYSGRNNSSSEAEYSAEQAKLMALKSRREQILEHRRVSFYGSSEEKSLLKSKINQDAQLQLYIKNQKNEEERQKALQESKAVEQHRQLLLEMERQRDQLKKDRLRETQESNRIAAISKKSQNLENKILQDMKDRDSLERSIYNYTPNVF